MKLTREERGRILAGDYSALRRRERPRCKPGDAVVLIWSRARTVVADRRTGETFTYPRRPLLWAELREPIRHRDGGWRIPIRVQDERVQTRFLGPSVAPSGEVLDEESDAARGYRPTRTGAIDHLEAVDDQELNRQRTKSRERWMEHREEMAAEDEARKQERSVREKLKKARRALPPPAAQALLAGVERLIGQALTEQQGESNGSTLPRRRAR